MSTRAVLTFVDTDNQFHVYKHGDGFPGGKWGQIACLKRALAYAFPLPRFEADDFAAAYVAANKAKGKKYHDQLLQGGDVRLTTHWSAHPDIEFRYVVYAAEAGLMVKVFKTDCDVDDAWHEELLFEGNLAAAERWAKGLAQEGCR